MKHVLEEIAEVRLKAQGAVKHYEKRFKAEEEKVEQERQLAELLQREFAVRAVEITLPCYSFLMLAISSSLGQIKQLNIVLELRIRGR
jgi:hypothetical protein